VLFSVGLAACGSDSNGSGSKSTAADTDTAKKLVLVASDFPAGWTDTPDDQQTTPEDQANAKELNDCVGTSGEEAEAAKWSGDGFSMNNYEVSSKASVVRDKSAYDNDVKAIKGSKLLKCVQTVYTRVLTKQLGTAPTSVEVTPLDVTSYGDATVAFRMKLVAGPDVADSAYLDLVLMGKNRAKVTGTFFSVGQPIDPAVEKALIDKLGGRLDDA